MSGRGITLLLCGLLLPGVSLAANNEFEQADAAARNNDHAGMQAAYERILAVDPRNIRALNGKATAQAWRGNYYAAAETFRATLAIDRDNLDALNGLGYAFAWAGDHELALEYFDRALAIAPDNVDAAKGRAYVALWSGDAETASIRFSQLAAADPDNADYAVALGQAELQRGETRSAVISFEQALSIDPLHGAALSGRRAAYDARPRGEFGAWYGSTTNAGSGLRMLEAAWWANDATRLAARYDDSLSLDNPGLARDGVSAETVTAQLQYAFSKRFTGVFEAGSRSLPDGDQSLYRAEAIVTNLPGRVTLGAQIGSHDAGYDDSLYYIGLGIPFAGHWQVESNNYFSTTGVDSEKEWRSVLNLSYQADTGWNMLIGAGAGEIDVNGVANPDRVTVAHALLSVPIFGYHRLHLTLRHESLPDEDMNVAMLGVTLRLPQ